MHKMLLPFSIPEQVPLIISGKKGQTTRRPGRYKVGDILHCWFKPRQKKTCGNCIIQDCKTKFVLRDAAGHQVSISTCSEHRNFFGKARVTGVLHCSNIFAMNSNKFDFETQVFKLSERWINGFDSQPEVFLGQWARADGFANFAEADRWFKKSTKDENWVVQPWDVVIFEPGWISPAIEEAQQSNSIPILNTHSGTGGRGT